MRDYRAAGCQLEPPILEPRVPLYNLAMPLTVFEIKGLTGQRRERIEAAVATGGKHAPGAHEAWIVADGIRPEFKVIITGPDGFQRTLACAMDEDPTVIRERVREVMED